MEEFILPSYYQGQIFTEGELIKPKGGVLADAEKASNDMIGIVKLVSGCLASVMDSNGETVSKKDTIEGIVRHMPYQTAEYLAMKIFAKRTDGAIEQIVHCPRCKSRYIYEYIDEDMDDRIKFDDLEVIVYENTEEPHIVVNLDSAIEIKSKKDQTILHSIENMKFRFPIMNDGISAHMKYPNDAVRRQYQMYISAMTHINGEEIDSKFKTMWGMFIFDRMDTDDIKQIADELQKYGMNKRLKHTCSECEKTFGFMVDTSNFFD